MAEHIPNTAVWGDGGGSTFRATADAIGDGIVNFEIGLVITTSPTAGILDQVREVNARYGMDIKTAVVEGRAGRKQTPEWQEKTLQVIEASGCRNITLMGCLVILSELQVDELNGEVPEYSYPQTLEGARELLGEGDDEHGYRLPESFPDTSIDTSHFRLRNTHPAPTIVTANTYGIHAQERLLALRAKESAQTLHVVGRGVDSGPVVAANQFPVDLPPLGASEEVQAEYAKKLFDHAQRIEKAHLPLDLAQEFKRQAAA